MAPWKYWGTTVERMDPQVRVAIASPADFRAADEQGNRSRQQGGPRLYPR